MLPGSNIGFLSFRSISLKICISILLIEGMFLFFLGFYFIVSYNLEIDKITKNKLAQPGILMSQQALHFLKATNHKLIGQLIQEEVIECLVINPNGTILFSADIEKRGKPYRNFLHKKEMALPFQASQQFNTVSYEDLNGNAFVSSLAPLTVDDLFFGNIFVRISAKNIKQKKQNNLYLFIIGSIITLLVTVIAEAIFIYNLIVPRIESTFTSLSRIEQDQLFVHQEIPPGPPDPIGIFIRRINAILSNITCNNQALKKLFIAGEQIANTEDKKMLYSVSTAIVCRFFKVLQGELDQLIEGEIENFYHQYPDIGTLSYSDDKRTLFLSLPHPHKKNEFLWAKFFRKDGAVIEETAHPVYLEHLSRIFKNAIRRISTFEEIAQAEERYRELFSSAVEGIFRTTESGRFEVINPALAAMSGYDSPEQMMQSITDIGTQFYAEHNDREAVFETLLREKKIIDREILFRRKNGSIFPAAVSLHYVKNTQGGIIAYEGRIVNIEERKLREQEEQNRKAAEAVSRVQLNMVSKLEKNEQQLQQSLKEKEVLLREIYHRTKNNMLVIISMLKLQLGDISDPTTHSIFQETENRIRAMAMVHENLYRSDSLVDIDLASYLTELATTLIKSMVINQHITMEAETEPVPISIDHAVPLGLAVNEIITNSLKHGFPDNRSGSIILHLCQSAENVIQLRVKDTGIGIPESFDIEKSSSFGLQITKNLIRKQLHGTITMRPDNGTETEIRFAEPERIQRILIS